MLHRPTFVAWFVSAYLLAYVIFLVAGNDLLLMIAEVMLLFSPLFICWMVYCVIRYGIFNGKELQEEEEYGYSDRPTEKLGTW
jgi:hypothetical protein